MAANTIIFWLILMVDWVIYIVIFFVGFLLALISYILTTSHQYLTFEVYKGTIAERPWFFYSGSIFCIK